MADNNNDNAGANGAIDALRAAGILPPDSDNTPVTSPQQQAPQAPQVTSPTLVNPGAGNAATTSLPDANANPVTSPTQLPASPQLNRPQTDSTILPAKFGDVAGSAANASNALGQEVQGAQESAESKYNAEKARSTRVDAVNQQYLSDLTQADKQYQIARDTAQKTAAAETAQWMQEMDQKAAQKPSPNNWWHDMSGFSKAMWLLSLAFSTKSAMTPGFKNVTAELIDKEIEDDMNRQKDAFNRQLEVSKLKGTILTKEHEQTLSNLTDDYTHKVGRINALLAANTAKANAASSEDLQAQYSAINADLGARKTAIATKRMESAQQERLKEVEEAHTDTREAIKLKHETAEKALDRDLQRELATEKIDAKMAEDLAKAKKGSERFAFPVQSTESGTPNIYIKHHGKDANGNDIEGKVEPFSVPKELAKEAGDTFSAGQAKIVGLTALRDSIEKNGLPYGATENSNESREKMAHVIDPIIRQMQGRFSHESAKALNDYVIGENPDSLWERMKGGSKEDIIKLLNSEIQDAPGELRQRMAGIPGTSLADNPNSELVMGLPDTRGKTEHVKTNDEKITEATGKAPESVRLNSIKDVKDFGDVAVNAMPSKLRSIVDDARAKLREGLDTKTNEQVVRRATEAIDNWNQKAMENGDDGRQRNNAYIILDDAGRQANKTAEQLPRIKEEILREHIIPTRADIETKLKESNLVMSNAAIKELIDSARQSVKDKAEKYGMDPDKTLNLVEHGNTAFNGFLQNR